MEWYVILGAVIGIVGFFITVFSLWYKIDRDTNTKIDAMKKDSDEKTSVIIKDNSEKAAAVRENTNMQIAELSKLFAANLAEAQKQGDEKRARIYERLDTVKTAHRGEMDVFRKEVFDSFVSVKWCSLLHAKADETYADFKKALETLNTKLDTLLERR